ncbi:RDD family protein [Xanthomonas cerealis pv. cerealis]|uniref:RDD family protein n=1 Tax=Xanthomonas cerealis TaxID=3390025 RepID=UPI001F4889A6|nr:RDD family protein [Xanthomonas translucens]UKE68407.1 RDD family protein [Xanthomonas translucens pv. pistacia]
MNDRNPYQAPEAPLPSAPPALDPAEVARTGQTWGKKLLSIRIVDLHGEPPPLWRLIVLRYLPTQLLSLVPVAGNVYALLDALFIFRHDKRCLHDIIAGTQVVNVRR